MDQEQEALLHYQELVKEGDLQEMFPTLTGSWKKDRIKFMKTFENNKAILDMDVFLDEDDYYDDEVFGV